MLKHILFCAGTGGVGKTTFINKQAAANPDARLLMSDIRKKSKAAGFAAEAQRSVGTIAEKLQFQTDLFNHTLRRHQQAVYDADVDDVDLLLADRSIVDYLAYTSSYCPSLNYDEQFRQVLTWLKSINPATLVEIKVFPYPPPFSVADDGYRVQNVGQQAHWNSEIFRWCDLLNVELKGYPNIVFNTAQEADYGL